jgi:hypothetical protein
MSWLISHNGYSRDFVSHQQKSTASGGRGHQDVSAPAITPPKLASQLKDSHKCDLITSPPKTPGLKLESQLNVSSYW